jgi:amino acid transporter
MKDLLRKLISKNVVTPVFVVFAIFAVLTFIVFPGLTVANTVINIVAAIIGLFTCLFVFYYINMDKLLTSFNDEPTEEVKPKKKVTKSVNNKKK